MLALALPAAAAVLVLGSAGAAPAAPRAPTTYESSMPDARDPSDPVDARLDAHVPDAAPTGDGARAGTGRPATDTAQAGETAPGDITRPIGGPSPTGATSPPGGAQLPAGAGVTLADLALHRGIERLKAGDAAGAIDMLRLSLQGKPDSAVALTALGHAYLMTDHQDLARLAVEAYKRAATLDPTSIHAREGAARTAWMLGDQEEALAQMEALYWADGQVRDRYASELVTYYVLSQQLDRGLQVLARALPRTRERHATMLLMATMLMQKPDEMTARLFVERVLAEAPPDSPAAQQARRMMAEGVAER
jgi:Tfp pilus assembly protein PilF